MLPAFEHDFTGFYGRTPQSSSGAMLTKEGLRVNHLGGQSM